MLKGILIPNKDDERVIKEYIARFRKKTDQELARAYFKQKRIGIVGIRRQMLYLIGLRVVLKERFGESPIEYDGKVLEI